MNEWNTTSTTYSNIVIACVCGEKKEAEEKINYHLRLTQTYLLNNYIVLVIRGMVLKVGL